MRPIMPEGIKEEQDRLVEEYMKSDEDITPGDFAYKYGSDNMRKYLDESRKRREENEKNGIIVN